MNPKELRIGNWANNYKADYQITSATIIQLERGYSTAIPILLTEEWLLKFGFKKATDRVFYLGDFGVDLGIETYFIIKQGNTFTRIKMQPYVHRLQNIYFELTDKELNR